MIISHFLRKEEVKKSIVHLDVFIYDFGCGKQEDKVSEWLMDFFPLYLFSENVLLARQRTQNRSNEISDSHSFYHLG